MAVIRFNHPEKHNAMSVEMWEGLALALTAARDHADTRVLVLTGEGGKAFVSGADISQFERNQSTPEARAEFGAAGSYRSLLANFPKPTIACIQGYCIGGGSAWRWHRHPHRRARQPVRHPAAKLSIAYPFRACKYSTHWSAPRGARMLLYSAMRIDAAEAERIGLITRMVDDADLWPHTLDLAERIASNAPLSVYAAKITIDQILKDPAERDMDAIRAIAGTLRQQRRCQGRPARLHGKTRAPVPRPLTPQNQQETPHGFRLHPQDDRVAGAPDGVRHPTRRARRAAVRKEMEANRAKGNQWKPTHEVMDGLKAKAKAAGLWNLFLPESAARRRPDQPRVRAAVRDHGPLPIGPEVVQLLGARHRQHGGAGPLRHARRSKERWLEPLLAGEIRSGFAMTEPDVASSDATNIQSRIVRDGDDYVINGRKWWTSGARRPALQDPASSWARPTPTTPSGTSSSR